MTFMNPQYIDTHCHLQDERFSANLIEVLERARRAGLTHFVCCGTRELDWDATRSLSRQHSDVIPLLGLHPWFIDGASPDWLERLEELLRSEGAGLGECGLDFAIEDADRLRQEQVFRDQLALARRLDLPVSIHCRRAWESLIAITKEIGLPSAGAAIHSFSGSAEVARQLQSLGFCISFSCSLANPENRRAAKAVLAVAEDRLLFETDAPDIPPPGVLASHNEPANISLVAEAAARLRGTDERSLTEKVHRNSLRIFGRLLA